MKKLLTNNLALKILSVIVAVLIWYVVVQTTNPIKTQSYDVPVTITHEDYLVNGKRTYRINDQDMMIRVMITDNKDTLSQISASDILLTADLTQIVDMEANPVYVPVTVSVNAVGITVKPENITLSRTTIPVTIENVAQVTVEVSADFDNKKPEKGYEVGKVTFNPSSVTISGPESIINIIGKVCASVDDIEGMNKDETKQVELKIYDKNGSPFKSKTMELLKFSETGNPPTVSAEIELWKKRENVKLEVEYSGEPARGFQVGEITTSPSEITVVGNQEALEQLAQNGNVIKIPASLVNIDHASQDRDDITVDLNKDVLDTKSLRASENTPSVKVMVAILPNGSREYQLDVERIQNVGLAEDLILSYDQSYVPIRVKASDEDLDAFDPSVAVQASIDLNGKTEGDYAASIDVVLPEGYELVDKVSTTIHLKRKAEDTKTALTP